MQKDTLQPEFKNITLLLTEQSYGLVLAASVAPRRLHSTLGPIGCGGNGSDASMVTLDREVKGSIPAWKIWLCNLFRVGQKKIVRKNKALSGMPMMLTGLKSKSAIKIQFNSASRIKREIGHGMATDKRTQGSSEQQLQLKRFKWAIEGRKFLSMTFLSERQHHSTNTSFWLKLVSLESFFSTEIFFFCCRHEKKFFLKAEICRKLVAKPFAALRS